MWHLDVVIEETLSRVKERSYTGGDGFSSFAGNFGNKYNFIFSVKLKTKKSLNMIGSNEGQNLLEKKKRKVEKVGSSRKVWFLEYYINII